MRRMFVCIAALILTACPAPEERMPEVRPLVDAAWLKENLEAVIPLDVRQDRPGAAFADAHIPGAAHSPYGQDPWRVTQDGVPGQMPRVRDLELLIGALGISNDDHVVIVSQGQSAVEFGSATRVYWQFKVLGHEKVAILDGGFNAWLAAGYPMEKGVNRRPRTTYTGNVQPRLVASKEDVLAARENGIPLIDARSANYYRGQAKARIAARYGTIAGAKNVPGDKLTVGNGGVLVDSAVAAALWSEAGIPITGEQITFCNIGHLASLAWFTAYEILGNRQARLYDGSLAEWSADPELPMENTEGPDQSLGRGKRAPAPNERSGLRPFGPAASRPGDFPSVTLRTAGRRAVLSIVQEHYGRDLLLIDLRTVEAEAQGDTARALEEVQLQ